MSEEKTNTVTKKAWEGMEERCRKIQLIALDLDRTTLRGDGTLSEANRVAITEAVAAGIHVVIASGRSFGSLPESVLSIPGIEYAITSNGAAIYRVAEERRCHEFLLRSVSVKQILSLVPEKYALEAFVEGTPYASADYVENPLAYGATPAAVTYIQNTRRPVQNIRRFISENIKRLDSIDVVLAGEDEKKTLRDRLTAKVRDVYITSSGPLLLELAHRNAGKYSGVRWISEQLGLSADQVAAFGDAENDKDMLLYAGLGVAMGNAAIDVKQAADVVTRDNESDGVAEVIRKILELKI